MGIIDSLFKKKLFKGVKVYLKEKYRVNELTAYDGVPTVYYDIFDYDDNRVGSIDLRLTVKGDMYYYGHVGYNIIKQYRGNHYAYHACKILFEIAHKEFDLDELIITCSPENVASYKTLKKLNGELIEQVEVPSSHPLYKVGEKSKYIFRYRINLNN